MARRPIPGVHEALLDAARDEFGRVGVDRARVEDIARRAGISKGAFYLHFRTKDDAFREIIQRFLGALEDHVRRRPEIAERAGRLAGAESALAAAFEAECAADVDLLELLWRNRQVIEAVENGGKAYRELLAGSRRRLRALVTERIGEGQRVGVLRKDVDRDVVADVVAGAYDDLSCRMADLRVKPDLAAWARSLLVVVYEGILARAEATPRRSATR
ncbi:MAG TPA: helix-turn-helix domain-containing protein [Anaeromyxobacter sp.]